MRLDTPEAYREFFTELATRWYRQHPEADQNKSPGQMYHDYMKAFGYDGWPSSEDEANERQTGTPGKSQKSRGKARLE